MNHKSLYWQLPLLALLIAGTVYIALQRQQENQPYQHDEGFIFGTTYNVTYQSADNLKADIEAELLKVDGEFSMFNDSSTVSRINRGEKPVLSDMYREVYELAQTVNRETYGAFDITVAPLVNAWGFGFKNQQMPTPEQVDSLLQIRSQLDFSAIAKGYGCDAVARLLQSRGVKNLMVEIGGEVVIRGKNPSGDLWRIGINRPVDDTLSVETPLQAVLNMTDRGMATSGNYRNFYYKGGRKYAHTIDPRTGYPVQHDLLSATVIAADCATADAYATSFMVLGLDSARKVLDAHPELQAYFIYTSPADSFAVWHSPDLNIK